MIFLPKYMYNIHIIFPLNCFVPCSEQLKKDTKTLDHPLKSAQSHKTRTRRMQSSQSVAGKRLKQANKTKTGSNATLPSKVAEVYEHSY